jgi:hypothetical protein
MYICPTHHIEVESGIDCPKCMEAEWMSFSDDPTPSFDDPGYACRQCGDPIIAAEGDDNDGLCETCAAGGEYPIDYSNDGNEPTAAGHGYGF